MKNNFEIIGDELKLKINKNIYSKEIVIQTTYVMLENYYFLIDEEDKNWIVFIKSKEENKISEEVAMTFFDELLESASYLDQLKRTSEIRQTILEKALISQTINDQLEED